MVRQVDSAMEVIETVYRLDDDEDTWLERIASALEPVMAGGLGLYAFAYDLATSPVRLHTLVERRPAFASTFVVDVLAHNSDALASGTSYDVLWRRSCFGSASAVMSLEPHYALGVRDVLGFNAFDASGHGVFVGAPHAKIRDVPAGEARLWTRVTAHLTAALRLRRGNATAVAVLSPNGRVEHAELTARLAPHREALRAAVARIERARGPERDDGEASTRLWRPLVKERYTLVDRFESDGRRYVVAYDNRPATAFGVLTEREREIVAAIADGQSSKHIAFALGLSDSTVRVLLFRAAKRLGVATREELVSLYRAHLRAD